MKRVTLNFLVDLAGFICLVGLVFTGVLLKYVLPAGSGGGGHGSGRGVGFAREIKTFCEMSRHQWGEIHFYFSAVFVMIMLLHIGLHYKWLKRFLLRDSKSLV